MLQQTMDIGSPFLYIHTCTHTSFVLIRFTHTILVCAGGVLNETGSIIHKVRSAGHPAYFPLAFFHHTYSSLLPLMLALFHRAYLSQQCADAHHGKLQTATLRFEVKSQKELPLCRLRADPLALAFSFFSGKIKDCFFSGNTNGTDVTASAVPSKGVTVTVEVRLSAASLLRPQLLTSKHTLSHALTYPFLNAALHASRVCRCFPLQRL